MLRRFLTTLFSSWIANPLAILIAHLLGVAQQPVVLLLLLGIGTSTPFQLLLNECLAAGRARLSFEATSGQLCGLVVSQVFTCVVTILWLTDRGFTLPLTMTLVVVMATNLILSYKSSGIYYQLVQMDKVTNLQAMMMGAMPGLISVVIYTAYSVANRLNFLIPPVCLLAVAVVPGLIQWLYMNKLGRGYAHNLPLLMKPQNKKLICALIALIILSSLSTSLRDKLAAVNNTYAALIIVFLNSALSVVNTLTRVSFFHSSTFSLTKIMLIMGTMFALIALALWSPFVSLASIAALISAQILIVAVIEAGRRMPIVIAKNRIVENKAV